MPNLSDYNPAIKYGANLDVNVDLLDIRDENNNELLELDSVASAVNYVRLTNAATGSNVELSAQGDDANIGLQLSPLGTGLTLVGGITSVAYDRGSATINAQRGRITDWTVAGVGTGVGTTVILRNNRIGASSNLIVSLDTRQVTTGFPIISGVEVLGGSATIRVVGMNAASVGTAALNFIVLS